MRHKNEDDIPDGTLWSGHRFRDIAAANLTQHPLELTIAEKTFYKYKNMRDEVGCVGAGVGGGFENMKTPNVTQRQKSVEEEYQRMEDNKACRNPKYPMPRKYCHPHGHEEEGQWYIQGTSQWSRI
jgi:hypothetical protein